MGKKGSKTLIGAFVLGALVLIVAGVLVFGSGKFFRERLKFVMFFEESIKGLNVGAPVIFRGVKIGDVTDIKLHFDSKAKSIYIEVIVEFEPERIESTGGRPGGYQYYQGLVDKGLRAQLQMQSFLTGQLMIYVDFSPDKPAKFMGLVKEYPEIPTIPTTLGELSKAVQDLPLKEIILKIDHTMEGIQRLVNLPETRESISSLNNTLKEAQALLKGIDVEVKAISTSLQNTLSSIGETSAQAKEALTFRKGATGEIAANLNKTIQSAGDAMEQAKETFALKQGAAGEIAANLNKTIKSADDALQEAKKTLASIQEIQKEENVIYEVKNTLKELSAAARSLRFLADFLERHPEALIKGKAPHKGE